MVGGCACTKLMIISPRDLYVFFFCHDDIFSNPEGRWSGTGRRKKDGQSSTDCNGFLKFGRFQS